MTDLRSPRAEDSLAARVKRILIEPKTEWSRIAQAPIGIGDIYRSHVLPLAAIGPVATFLGGQIFGHGAFGITYRPSLVGGIATALVSYALTLIGTYIVALIIEWLAPQFGAVKDRTRAFKVAAYSFTAAWIAGIFGLVPAIGFLSILGLYSLYLLYLGLPVVMQAPSDKAGNYAIVTIIISVVAGILLGLLTAPIAALFGGSMLADHGRVSGSLNVPGAGSVDLSKLEEATKKMEEAANRAQRGEAIPAIAPDILQALLPAALPGGLVRKSVESSSAGAAGISGSNAEGVYGGGPNENRLQVTDLGAMGGLAALGGALNVQSSKQTETGYERVGKVDGRMTTEEWDARTKRGKYATLVGDRIMVSAEGNAASPDAFKAAVASIDLAQVEALARR